MGRKVKEFTVLPRSKHPNKMCPEGVNRKKSEKIIKEIKQKTFATLKTSISRINVIQEKRRTMSEIASNQAHCVDFSETRRIKSGFYNGFTVKNLRSYIKDWKSKYNSHIEVKTQVIITKFQEEMTGSLEFYI